MITFMLAYPTLAATRFTGWKYFKITPRKMGTAEPIPILVRVT